MSEESRAPNGAADPEREEARLQVLASYNILDTAAEEAFDDLTRLAAQICGVPIALVGLMDRDRLWLKSSVGLEAREFNRRETFCERTLQQCDLLSVEDASADPQFSTLPLVTGPAGIRSYAGVPLLVPSGPIALGTLCVMDRSARAWSGSWAIRW